MKKNLVHVIYTADKVISIVHNSDYTVENNPNMVHGPWFALNDVMRQRFKNELVTA